MTRVKNEAGNAAAGGCLLIIGFFVLIIFLLGSCVEGNKFDDGDDSNDCYYSDPIPHWDECR